MKKIFILTLILFPFLSKAQNCNCSENFRFLVEKIKNNYVGYKDKITASNQTRFDVFTDSLQKIANSAEKSACLDLCVDWLAFFEDKHLSISFTPDGATKDEISDFFKTAEKTYWNEVDLNSYLSRNKKKLDKIEGYWTYGLNNYKIGIVKDTTNDKNEFIGFIVNTTNSNWGKQQVKMRIKKIRDNYQCVYFRNIDHSKRFPRILINENTMDLGLFGKWYKSQFMEKREEAIRSTASDIFPSFTILDKETNLLVLPSFNIRYKEKVDSVIKQNKDLLGNSKHLIIDIRSNQGGTTTTYEGLLPYIYTNPIYTTAASILATTDNINGLYHPDIPGLSEVTRKKFEENVRKMNEHKNEFYLLYPPDTIQLAHVLKNPQRISILINGESASAAEIMILNYRQSKKVTLFGQNSSGAIDYVDVLRLKVPCSYFSILYPAVRYNSVDTHPLNNSGIAPDVIIPDSVQDWVEYVRTYKPVH